MKFIFGPFAEWIKVLEARGISVVWVAGNHDQVLEELTLSERYKEKKIFQETLYKNLPGIYLQDQLLYLKGLKIYGSPWQPWFYDWAFNKYEEDLVKIWEKIPEGLDILLLHGPPYGYGDQAGKENVGSKSLLEKIKETKPKLVVSGHIHPGYGKRYLKHGDQKDPTIIVNASLVNSKYQPVNEPLIIDL